MDNDDFQEIDEAFDSWCADEAYDDSPYANFINGFFAGYNVYVEDSLMSDSNAVEVLHDANVTLQNILEETTEESLASSAITLSCSHVRNIIELLNAYVGIYEGVDPEAIVGDFKGHLSYNSDTRH